MNAIHILFLMSTEGPVKHPLKTAKHTSTPKKILRSNSPSMLFLASSR